MKANSFLFYAFILILSISLVSAQEKLPILEEPINLSPLFETLVRIVFGVNDLSLGGLIILITIWVFVYLLLVSILKLTPFFKDNIAYIAGAAIMILFGVSGLFRFIQQQLLDLAALIKFLGTFSAGAIIFVVVSVILAWFILTKVLKAIKENAEIESIHQTGVKIGAETAASAKMRKAMKT